MALGLLCHAGPVTPVSALGLLSCPPPPCSSLAPISAHTSCTVRIDPSWLQTPLWSFQSLPVVPTCSRTWRSQTESGPGPQTRPQSWLSLPELVRLWGAGRCRDDCGKPCHENHPMSWGISLPSTTHSLFLGCPWYTAVARRRSGAASCAGARCTLAVPPPPVEVRDTAHLLLLGYQRMQA